MTMTEKLPKTNLAALMQMREHAESVRRVFETCTSQSFVCFLDCIQKQADTIEGEQPATASALREIQFQLQDAEMHVRAKWPTSGEDSRSLSQIFRDHRKAAPTFHNYVGSRIAVFQDQNNLLVATGLQIYSHAVSGTSFSPNL
jgi:hypothetical protein